ncbi:hypothetical protein ACMGDK_11270 [Chryseobacterium sp. DT-3]|uniref:hypothetical protein n=1 Tax=Chryseobacterium sp. DT-3 TaxID=3396164 RepID=UPI003F194061
MTKEIIIKILIAVLTFTVVMFIFYLAYSFYWLDTNPANWDRGARGGLIIFGGSIAISSSIGIFMGLESNKRK